MKTFALAIMALVLTAGASNAATQTSCVASLTFDTFTVLADTDETPPFTHADQWTIHVYAYVNGTLGKVNPRHDGGASGNTGASKAFNTQMISNVVVGLQGDSVNFKIVGGLNGSRVKEMDGNGKGVAPADTGIFSLNDTIPCIPGTYTYPLDVSVPASPGGMGEHDGLSGLQFTLTLG